MQRNIIFMLDVYARPPPPTSASNVSLDEGIARLPPPSSFYI
jgi:hypothetical protein